MRTQDPNIFAAGDCAQVLGRVAGLYSAASAGGQIAGAVMAGEELVYTPIIPATAFEQLGISLFVVGTVNGDKLKFITYHDPFKGVYKKLAFDDNGLCGVVLLGDTEPVSYTHLRNRGKFRGKPPASGRTSWRLSLFSS